MILGRMNIGCTTPRTSEVDPFFWPAPSYRTRFNAYLPFQPYEKTFGGLGHLARASLTFAHRTKPRTPTVWALRCLCGRERRRQHARLKKSYCTPRSLDHLLPLSPKQYPMQPLPTLLPGHGCPSKQRQSTRIGNGRPAQSTYQRPRHRTG